jgi:hypothetical protein
MTLPVLLVFCSGVLETLRVEILVMRFLEKFQIAPVTVTREQGERKRLYVYTILCKPRDEIESQERGDRASYSCMETYNWSEPFLITACIEDVPFAKPRV